MTEKIIGFVAACLTTGAFVPQAIKTWRTKSTDDLSPVMFILFCLGILLWLFYGIMKHDLPMILANSVTICLAGIILFYVLKPMNTKKIEHIAIQVQDLEKMKDFYVDNLGAKAGKQYTNIKTGFSSYFISLSSGTRIELMHYDNQEPVKDNKNHMAISLGSRQKVDSFTENLRNKGVRIVQIPRTTGDGYYESVIEDIEGNLIEITV
jgi:lactoylglutathione lyase